jgi:hypothetical protein
MNRVISGSLSPFKRCPLNNVEHVHSASQLNSKVAGSVGQLLRGLRRPGYPGMTAL